MTEDSNTKVYGLLAEYDTTAKLVKACEKVRDAGYTKWDSYAPFPVHGIDPAMGIKPTKLPWLIFGAGITGTCVALLMQWWMNAYDYEYLISGKPLWSLPANVPVGFELTVLFSALTAIFGCLAINMLPSFHHPLNRIKKFARATDDRFFIAIEAADPKYNPTASQALLRDTDPLSLEVCEDDRHIGAAIPKPLLAAGLCFFVAGFIPLAVIGKARVSHMENTRIHPNPNMDFQQKFKSQSENSLYADGRSMRSKIPGTVAVGEAQLDDHFFRGIVDDQWAATLPKQVVINQSLLANGQKQFNIHCSACHGETGDGNGMVNRRALSTGQSAWVPPTSLHQGYLRTQPHGQIFNTITNGIRNMMGYGHSVAVNDRWAIVAYIRALQRSQYAKVADLKKDKQSKFQ
ncbi:MAG: quinol:electron acceptor oxidoreductase subunit ActD [Myxococcota bacterium]|nr:quinol:electron acceptor oxidoreductase subunit ActD [Myxococcota bacterium]